MTERLCREREKDWENKEIIFGKEKEKENLACVCHVSVDMTFLIILFI